MQWFKDHKAEVHRFLTPSSTDYLEYLLWKKPQNSIYMVKYYCHQGTLMITGDAYEAIHCWGNFPQINLRWISGCDFGYYMSKMQASQHGRDGRRWQARAAKEKLDLYFKDKAQDFGDNFDVDHADAKLQEQLLVIVKGHAHQPFIKQFAQSVGYPEERLLKEAEAFNYTEDPYDMLHDKREWEEFLQSHGAEVFGEDGWMDHAGIGMETDQCFYGHWLGLKMAFEQLKG